MPSEVTTLTKEQGANLVTLVSEYLKDMSLNNAARRAGLSYKDAFHLYKLALFEQIKDEMVLLGDPKDMFPRNRLLMRLWEEAHDYLDGNAGSRATAAKTLIEVLGYGPEEEEQDFDAPAAINLTLQKPSGPPDAIDAEAEDLI